MLDWLAYWLVRALGAFLRWLPAPVAVWLGACVGELIGWVQPKRTRIGIRNIRAAFDGRLTLRQARRIILSSYRQVGAAGVELLRLPAVDRAYVERYVTVEGRRHFDAAVTSGRPVIFLTGHFGNWELSSLFGAVHGYPVVALARAQDKFPRLYQLLVSYREAQGCIIVHKGGSMRRLVTALDRGQFVGIVGDQASRQGIFVDFFGRPALFATGPFALAYLKDAIVLPAFLHRVRGPSHRFVVEPPLTIRRSLPKAEAIREGIEQFAKVLAAHITQDPAQWLWMHKRWKHTPARRLLVLSDGKRGHVKQLLAVVEACKDVHPQTSHHLIEVRYRHSLGRFLMVCWSLVVPHGWGAPWCLRRALTRASSDGLLRRSADVIISCGASTAPVNLSWAAATGAKPVVIMDPSPLPLHRFHLVIAPQHDRLPRRGNVVQTSGAIARATDDAQLREAAERLTRHPRFHAAGRVEGAHPSIAVFIGGGTAHYELGQAFAESLIVHVMNACEGADGQCAVTTSRRTAPEVERLLSDRLGTHPRCRLLLIANRDPIDGTMEGLLGFADVAVVTGESISMVSEACASGRRVIVVEPPLRRADRAGVTKHRHFLNELAAGGYARLVALPELSLAIQRALKDRQPAKRLDDLSHIRAALSRLI